MQAHLLCCQKDHFVQEPNDIVNLVNDEIKMEIDNVAMLTESIGSDQNAQTDDCDHFEFGDSKHEINGTFTPDSVRVKQEPLEPDGFNFETVENRNVNGFHFMAQVPTEDIEIAKIPKIDSVFKLEQAMTFHENKSAESTKEAKDCDPYLNGNQMIKANDGRVPPLKIKLNSFVSKQTSIYFRNQTGEKPWVCDWPNCGKKYKTNFEKTIHLRTHTGEKPFVCDWENCGKRFKTSFEKTVRLRSHTGEKPFSCHWENCGKKFATSSAKNEHLRTHTGEKPYTCDWENCGKKFKTSTKKIEHLRAHTGEKPYTCDWENCGKKFKTSSQKNKHFRTHTSGKPYACN